MLAQLIQGAGIEDIVAAEQLRRVYAVAVQDIHPGEFEQGDPPGDVLIPPKVAGTKARGGEIDRP
ncbi:hypothetical protein [Rhabdochromatium marinum]|uniref:hypothetical protein n=1 Tax=Rhabdochromatium marinum TaxID=48729 RepID=UPI001F5BCECA|nr:hypothetical protein [Rhabdochromatium marinum]